MEKDIFKYIKNGDSCVWEEEPLEALCKNNLLAAYLHNGFWCPMDTLRDKRVLNKLWSDGKAPWRNW